MSLYVPLCQRTQDQKNGFRNLPKRQFTGTVDIITKGSHDLFVGRYALPIGDAMVAYMLADHLLRQGEQNPGVPSRARWLGN